MPALPKRKRLGKSTNSCNHGLRAMRAGPLAVLVAALAGCGGQRIEPVDKPKPPDLSALRAAYDAPTGVLDDAVMQQIAADATATATRLSELGVTEPLLGAVDSVLAELNSSSSPELHPSASREAIGAVGQALAIEGDGWLRATRICNGWGAEPTPAPDNGTIVLTATFTEHGPDPTLWGSIADCKYRVMDTNVMLDSGADGGASDFELWIGEALGWHDLGSQPILFNLDMLAELQGSPISVAFDFRLDLAADRVEIRVAAGGGDLIVILGGGQIVGVRAINGVFSCDPVNSTCVSDTGLTVSW